LNLEVVNHKATRIDAKKGREIDDEIEIFGNLNSSNKMVKIPSEEIKEGDVIKE
jgi:membrane fusion protein (multidrug efflux system)